MDIDDLRKITLEGNCSNTIKFKEYSLDFCGDGISHEQKNKRLLSS